LENSPEFMNSSASGQDAWRHAKAATIIVIAFVPQSSTAVCEKPLAVTPLISAHWNRLAISFLAREALEELGGKLDGQSHLCEGDLETT
jgi:hypothetical protein